MASVMLEEEAVSTPSTVRTKSVEVPNTPFPVSVPACSVPRLIGSARTTPESFCQHGRKA